MKPVILYLAVQLYFLSVNAQCVSTSFISASTFSSDNSIGIYNFSSPGNAQSSNNARASAASLISLLSGDTYYLKATGFGFTIPSYASICGITAEVECRATGLLLTAAIRDNEVKLIKDGVITGANKALPGDWGSTDAYRSYGGVADLWSTTLTPADVNDPDFGIAFSASIIALIAALPSADIDHIRLKVDYNPILPVHLLYFTSGFQNGRVSLEWETAEEEDNAVITLQRSYNNGNWSDIKNYQLNVNNKSKVYQYEEIPQQNGQYAYRLKITAASGMVIYSTIQHAVTGSADTLSVFPNPAADFIILSPVLTTENIAVHDAYGRYRTLSIEKTGTHSCRVNIQSLSAGIYYVTKDGHSLKFLKY